MGLINPTLGFNLILVADWKGETIVKIASHAVPFVLCIFIIVVIFAYVHATQTTFLPGI